MRIAFVTTSYPAFPGDPCGHFVETEAKEAALSDEVFVVGPIMAPVRGEEDAGTVSCGRGAKPAPTVLRLEGHGAFGWPGVASRVRAHPHLLLGAARWALDARRTLRGLPRLDRIIAHWAVPCGWPVADGLDAPLEIVSHGGDVRLLLGLPGWLRHAVIERVLRRAEAWRFVSWSLLTSLLKALDARRTRHVESIARVEACPIEIPDVRAEAREKRALHPGGPLAVCVGRLVPAKDMNRVVDFVATELAPATRLVVVGDGPLRSRLEGHARARGVDALFVGKTTREEALAWILAADVVLHASRAEGLSTVEREARALGVPFCFVGTVPARSDLR